MGGANQENQSELLEYYRLAYEKEKKKIQTWPQNWRRHSLWQKNWILS